MTSTRTFALAKASFLLLIVFSTHASAGNGPHTAVQKLISTSLDQPDSRVVTELGDLETRLDGCNAPAAFLPYPVNASGGRSTVGFRCEGDEEHPRYAQVNVRVLGAYWVPAMDIPRGAVITHDMLVEKTGDLSKLPRNVMLDDAQIIGQQTNRALKANSAVQRNALQAVFVVKRNAMVEVQASGPGFMIKREGVAMDNGALGGAIRVKLKGGGMIRATVISQNVLKIDI